MPKDLKINSNLDIELDDRNDLPMINGSEELEQSLAVQLTMYLYNEVGSTSEVNVKERLRLKARRIVDANDRVDTAEQILVEESEGEVNNYDITVVYETSDGFEFTI